jgi:putative membrane protein
MRVDWSRVARGLALAAWGGFFIYLLVSNRATTYIGPKTAWVVKVGALALPVIALLYLARARGRERTRTPSYRELASLGLVVAPIVLAIMVPAPSLGALAVANKRGRNTAVPQGPPKHGRVRLYEIAWASQSASYAAQNGIEAGRRVDFTGFVSDRGSNGGPIELSRFYITCCAADAVANSISVTLPVGAPNYKRDTWVRVRGTLTRVTSLLIVAASSVERIPKPSDPYN